MLVNHGRLDRREVIIQALNEHGKMTITEEKMKLQEELSLVTYMSLVMEQRMEIVKLLGINVNSNKTCSDCRNTGQETRFSWMIFY